jgi:hypothetical protein
MKRKVDLTFWGKQLLALLVLGVTASTVVYTGSLFAREFLDAPRRKAEFQRTRAACEAHRCEGGGPAEMVEIRYGGVRCMCAVVLPARGE